MRVPVSSSVAVWAITSAVAISAAAPQPPVERFATYCGHATKLFDAETLVKDWRAAEMPGTPKDRIGALSPAPAKPDAPVPPPVPVVRSSTGAPVYDLDFGRLDVGCYVVRVIAMAKPDDVDQYRKPLFMDLRVTLPDGIEEYHRQRIPYTTDFYAVAELYFLIDTPGPCRGKLSVGAGSAVDLYIHNIEFHDVLKGLPQTAAKQRPGLFSAEERDVLRKNVKPDEARASVAKVVRPMDPLWSEAAKPLTPKDRAARDDLLWNAFPPINSQCVGWYPTAFPLGEILQPPASVKKAVDEAGAWDGPMWNLAPLTLTNTKLKLTYTRDDFLHHRPLPDPYPAKDDGGGVYFPAVAGMEHAQNYAILAAPLSYRWRTMIGLLGAHDGNDIVHRVPYLYHALGNRNAARDAAFLLCRWAHIYPTFSDAMILSGSLIAPAGIYKRDLRLRTRFLNEGVDGLQQGLAVSYDYLFDYIKGNQELAQAVGRFVPWVRTDEDVRRLIETRILQFGARQVMHFNVFNDKETPTFLMRLAAVQQAPDVTRPWMEFLWSRTWVYPHARAGLPDYLSTTTQRDGSTDIGSVYYSQGGTPFLELALMTHRYVLNGGDTAYDLADVKRYRKVADACNFPLAASVAGYPLSVGDVGGPAKPRIFALFMPGLEENFRSGAELTGDPALAWITANYYGRGGENDAQWAALTRSAALCKSNPFLGQPSRVLTNWSAILETGQEAQDYRFIRAAMMRIGTGVGHQHWDTLDLQMMAHGVRAMNDVGWRGGYTAPHPTSSQLHSLVEIDETNWQGHAWIAAFAPARGAQYMRGVAVSPANVPGAGRRTREVALIDVDDGAPGVVPPAPLPYTDKTRFDPAAITPNSYIVDVQRQSGGGLHTFCFHGTLSDDFQINLPDRGELTNDVEKNYLRRFAQGPGMKTAGTVPDVLQATWRLRRNEETLKVIDRDGKETNCRLWNAEAMMQGAAYDPKSPPKFTRLHLLGRAGDRALVAWPCPTEGNPDKVTWPFLFVQKRGPALETVHLSVVESYAGQPFIASVREVPVPENEADVLRAVAVEVRTVNGHRDLTLSNPRGKRRVVGDVTATAGFAVVSTDDRGLRLAAMTEGTELTTQSGTLRMAKPAWSAKVTRVDYWDRRVFLDADWSDALLPGEQIEFGNDKHRTTYTVVSASREGGATVLSLDKALDLSYAHVAALDPAKGTVVVNIGPAGLTPGMTDGLTCSNADNSRTWPCTVVGGDSGRYTYKLNTPFKPEDFPVGSVFQLWEFGPGDLARLAARASVRRTDGNRWVIESNGKADWTPARGL